MPLGSRETTWVRISDWRRVKTLGVYPSSFPALSAGLVGKEHLKF